MKYELIRFVSHGDDRGQLIAIENKKNIPFDIKRIYYIYSTEENAHRGFHAHKSLDQVLICIHGSCTILMDDGQNKQEVVLNNPSEGLYLNNCIWREMYNFSKDAVLLVLASDYYNEEDYIREYSKFLEYIKNE